MAGERQADTRVTRLARPAPRRGGLGRQSWELGVGSSTGWASGLTHNEAFGFREFAKQFPEVLVPLFVCGAQHLGEV